MTKTWWYADLMHRMQKHFCCVENKEGYMTQSEADCQAVALTLQPMVIPTPPAAGGPCCWWVGEVPAQGPQKALLIVHVSNSVSVLHMYHAHISGTTIQQPHTQSAISTQQDNRRTCLIMICSFLKPRRIMLSQSFSHHDQTHSIYRQGMHSV